MRLVRQIERYLRPETTFASILLPLRPGMHYQVIFKGLLT